MLRSLPGSVSCSLLAAASALPTVAGLPFDCKDGQSSMKNAVLLLLQSKTEDLDRVLEHLNKVEKEAAYY